MGKKISTLSKEAHNVSKTNSTKLVESPSPSSPKAKNTDVLASYKDNRLCKPEKSEVTEREFHSEEKASYWLPKDEEEQHRLTGQHFAIKELFEGNILPNVREIIDFKKGVSVLDVGCGSGVWIMDMFNDYPNCTYEGCDIIDIAYKNVDIKQINYSFGNVIEGLKYADNTFDFVHMRLLVLALKIEEWPIAIKEVLRVTKPGGIIQLVEGDVQTSGGPLVQKLGLGIKTVSEMQGQDPRIIYNMERILNDTDGCELLHIESRTAGLLGDSSLSKKFRWDIEKIAAMITPKIGSIVNLETKEKQDQFLIDLHEELLVVQGNIPFKAFAIRKL